MDFSSILLRNTRLTAVLRNLFAFLVSVDVIYCQHARKSYLFHRLKPGVSSETKEERAREESTREGSLQLINILDYDLVFIPVLLPCHWALGTGMPCLQRHMNKQLLQKCFYL
ncbi:uncharacterized protein [Acropora muricata]|uniref:uncharacterized protein n=1 Tax=Acropora muricata TaxID=159855 RepID=UPI0034E3BD50